MISSLRLLPRIVFVAAVLFCLLTPIASGQFTLRPGIGIHTIVFNGDYPARDAISPLDDRSWGGGLRSSNNAARLQLELIPDPQGIFRIPISLEYYSFIGKTTFAGRIVNDPRKQRAYFRYEANMISAGLGVTASFFKSPSLYFGLEGKFNYIPQTDFTYRATYADNGELIEEKTRHPHEEGQSRIGAYTKVGTQLDFFDPVLLDFSIGYGAINLFGKDTNPATQRNLLVSELERHDPETTLGYIGASFSIIWEL